MKTHLKTPLTCTAIKDLRIGDVVYLTGRVYTMRDMAHMRIKECLREKKLPFEDLHGAAIFHAGPVVKKERGKWKLSVIGPTTSMRMEPFSDLVLGELGVKAIIGKGGMGESTEKELKKHCGIYLLCAPGCAVVHAKFVKQVAGVYWLDLGMPEAIWVLEVDKWGPLVVAMDSQGHSIFKEVKTKALNEMKRIINQK